MYSRYLKLCYAGYDWSIDFSNGPMKTNEVQYETFDRARSAAPDLPRQVSIFRFSFITNLFYSIFFSFSLLY